MPRSMPALWTFLLIACLGCAVPQADASEVPQSVTVYCQTTLPGTHYGAQFTPLPGQAVAANAYVLTFSDSSAALSTTTGTVLATSSLPPLQTLVTPSGFLLYPSPSAGMFSQQEGVPVAEIIVNTGSSLGSGPYGVTGCELEWSGDPQFSAIFTVANDPAILAATPVLAGPTTPNGAVIAATIGSPFSYQITATNTPTVYSSVYPLPTGLTLDTSTGLITGTPTGTAGTFPMVFKAANAAGTGSIEDVLNIAPNAGSPVISSALSTTATDGTAFSYQITASNTPTSYAATQLPAGVTISGTGLLHGTPTLPGAIITYISATNASGTGMSQVYINIAPAASAPEITSAISVTGTVGTPFSFPLTAGSTASAFDVVGTTLPPALNGLTLDAATGVISGTPTQTGITQIGIYAVNGGVTGSTSFLDIVINGSGPVFTSPATSPATAAGIANTAFSYTVAATGATSYGLIGQPSGLSINATTGVISGQTSATGTYVATVSATNASGTSAQTLTITINGSAATPPAITSATTAPGVAGTAFSYQITASQSPTSYGASFLPVGLTLNPTTGVLSGTLAIAGTSYVTISATNAGGTGSALLVISTNGGGAGTAGGTTTATTTTAGTTTGGQASSGGGGGGCGLGGSGAALILFAMLALRLGAGRQRSAVSG